MRRRLALGAELLAGRHKADAEDLLPERLAITRAVKRVARRPTSQRARARRSRGDPSRQRVEGGGRRLRPTSGPRSRKLPRSWMRVLRRLARAVVRASPARWSSASTRSQPASSRRPRARCSGPCSSGLARAAAISRSRARPLRLLFARLLAEDGSSGLSSPRSASAVLLKKAKSWKNSFCEIGSYLWSWHWAQAIVVPIQTAIVVLTRSTTATLRNSSSFVPPSLLVRRVAVEGGGDRAARRSGSGAGRRRSARW